MPNCYEKNMNEPWFTWSKQGKKTVEGRANHASFSKIKKGDVIIWFNDDCGPNSRRYLKTKVVTTKVYKNFEDMLKNEGLKNVIPFDDVYTIKQGTKILYHRCSKKIIDKYGVLALKFKVIK